MNDPLKLSEVMDRFPPVEVMVGYGSAFYPQGYDSKYFDFIFGVKDSLQWHEENLERNPNDYSALMRFFGASDVAALQDLGAGVFFNIGVQHEDTKIKYGVIGLERMIKDLKNWDDMYVAGRLHKPARICTSNQRIRNAVNINFENAINVAGFLLEEGFDRRELYEMITSLSYKGDMRMFFAENPRKVNNIVDNNLGWFERTYGPFVEEKFEESSKGLRHKETDIMDRMYGLPQMLVSRLEEVGAFRHPDERAIRRLIENELMNKVQVKSIEQALKGFVSSRLSVSLPYALSKCRKFLGSGSEESSKVL